MLLSVTWISSLLIFKLYILKIPFLSLRNNNSLFELKGGVIVSKQSKPMDIRNYIRADRFYTRSDIRLKSNIEDLTDNDLDKLKKVVPKSYNFKNDLSAETS